MAKKSKDIHKAKWDGPDMAGLMRMGAKAVVTISADPSDTAVRLVVAGLRSDGIGGFSRIALVLLP